MDPVSLQVGLVRIQPERAVGVSAASDKDAVAQSFDELFLSLLLKDLQLGGESAGIGGMWNDLARASLTRELSAGQNLGLGRLLVEQYYSENITSGENP